MDLGTIKKRLENDYYYSAKECIKEFNTVFTNQYEYNKQTGGYKNDQIVMTQILEKFFQSKLATMPKDEVEIKISGEGSASNKRSFQAATSSMASNNVDSNTQVGLELQRLKIKRVLVDMQFSSILWEVDIV